ncbi:MAG TPA: ammonium transporter [Acidimicrobiales bacterium]|nr:ammonium transporter [Acidimicrobiales bacterium]
MHPVLVAVSICAQGFAECSDKAWLNTGDNAWQLTAATFVALMSVPGLAVLFGGLVQKKWVVNTMLMAFAGFAAVLIVWVLWAYDMGFGSPIFHNASNNWNGSLITRFIDNFVGRPGTVISSTGETGQATVPLLQANNDMPPFGLPMASVVYFQFVFAAITPLLFLGSVLARIKFKVWCLFVPLWTSLAYSVNAYLLWGGGFWAHQGAGDFSGGYVIHLAAGTSGFVAAAMIGPRLKKDREKSLPHSLPLIAIGGGIVWLGWNGFNGGDPYFASADAAAAVINTNMATAAALLTWVIWDMYFGPAKKPTFLGAINGMVVGLVAITPCAGYVNGAGAMLVGAIDSTVVWMAWTYLSRASFMKRVDDAMGIVYTHGIAGLVGGLLLGVFADPSVVVYQQIGLASGSPVDVSVKGALYGHPGQIAIQFGAALTVIIWDALVTFVILTVLKFLFGGSLRYDDATCEVGDLAVHDEEGYPDTEGVTRILPGYGTASPIPASTGAASTSAPTVVGGA